MYENLPWPRSATDGELLSNCIVSFQTVQKVMVSNITLRNQKHEISGNVCSCHIPLDRFFGNTLANLAGEAHVFCPPDQ